MTLSKLKFVGIDLVKPTRFFLCDQPVNVYIPLPERTCSNWSDSCNENDNIGVLYRGRQVTMRQLRHIIKCFENVPDRDIHCSLDFGTLSFDGHEITSRDINDIKHILCTVMKMKSCDRYGDRREFMRDTKMVL